MSGTFRNLPRAERFRETKKPPSSRPNPRLPLSSKFHMAMRPLSQTFEPHVRRRCGSRGKRSREIGPAPIAKLPSASVTRTMCGPPAPAQNCSGNCRTRHQSRRRHAWKRKLDDLQEDTRAANTRGPRTCSQNHEVQNTGRAQNQGAAVCGSPKPAPGMSKPNKIRAPPCAAVPCPLPECHSRTPQKPRAKHKIALVREQEHCGARRLVHASGGGPRRACSKNPRRGTAKCLTGTLLVAKR